MDNYKPIRSKMTSPEATNNIVKDVAVEFAKWTWKSDDEDAIGLPFDKLFDYWLNNIYESSTNNGS